MTYDREPKTENTNGKGGAFELKYGYRSRRQFLLARSVNPDVFENMARDHWWFQKSALLHPECPSHIRDWFSRDPVWYKRLVAYFATKGPEGYWSKSANDPDKRIQRIYRAITLVPSKMA
jgi:hypothetical protein